MSTSQILPMSKKQLSVTYTYKIHNWFWKTTRSSLNLRTTYKQLITLSCLFFKWTTNFHQNVYVCSGNTWYLSWNQNTSRSINKWKHCKIIPVKSSYFSQFVSVTCISLSIIIRCQIVLKWLYQELYTIPVNLLIWPWDLL